eukprot:1161669-Pelagomonas_calceolata.AAC.10
MRRPQDAGAPKAEGEMTRCVCWGMRGNEYAGAPKVGLGDEGDEDAGVPKAGRGMRGMRMLVRQRQRAR